MLQCPSLKAEQATHTHTNSTAATYQGTPFPFRRAAPIRTGTRGPTCGKESDQASGEWVWIANEARLENNVNKPKKGCTHTHFLFFRSKKQRRVVESCKDDSRAWMQDAARSEDGDAPSCVSVQREARSRGNRALHSTRRRRQGARGGMQGRQRERKEHQGSRRELPLSTASGAPPADEARHAARRPSGTAPQ